jgi:4-hydroxy-3-methylbut-2-enyl diphosphate reductase
MIIIGSFTSANSKRLAQLSIEINPNTHQVNSESELDEKWFNGCDTVGISAGASTPDYLIDEVRERIKSFSEKLQEV